MNSRRFFAFALIASVLALLLSVNSTPSQAQAWPTRQPIRVIVPLTAGSAIDIVGRLVFGEISNQIGQTVVIENRAGASQTIGAAAVAKADPDGTPSWSQDRRSRWCPQQWQTRRSMCGPI